ncbi:MULTISPECIES: hypothetical protein [unclassified Paracoccus (in: a-proteobacteria)]|uniref:hypothetical protein n=1 Tax=unclassified Paracoccus (in: a-proteobacteria) TaxID=2688777 RepID=UPI0012B3647A|nr:MULTISPECIES: hypothetical protein [unclassified Paracoccus (in: a-proteobacteria)]UXU73701.1 hypothetical protein GB879_007045 [Paracoccus sp. SMMA_5]UXU79591.1 hypothetical protein GB880_007035 [Paracoccus sp. SMMA_5_TC]
MIAQKQLAAVAAVNSTGGLAGVSMAEFHGRAKVIILHAASGGPTATIAAKLQHRNGSEPWEDIPGAAAPVIDNQAGVKEIEVDADGFKDEVRLHCTVNNGAAAALGAVVVGARKYAN